MTADTAYMDEINNLKEIKSVEFIVKFHENFNFQKSLYIVTEFCEVNKKILEIFEKIK